MCKHYFHFFLSFFSASFSPLAKGEFHRVELQEKREWARHGCGYVPLRGAPSRFSLLHDPDRRSTFTQVKTVTPKIDVEELLGMITRAFYYAYMSHASGTPEVDMIIEFDIEAAYCEVDKHSQSVVRKTIKAACRAVDECIGLEVAHEYLNTQLRDEINRHTGLQPNLPPLHRHGCTHIRCPWCNEVVPTDQPLHDCQV